MRELAPPRELAPEAHHLRWHPDEKLAELRCAPRRAPLRSAQILTLLLPLSSEAQSTRLQAVVLESQIGQLKEACVLSRPQTARRGADLHHLLSVAAAQADAARKDGDLALDRQALMQAKDEADGLRHRLEVAELDGARAARNAEDACQQLAVIESRLVATQVALGEEKGGRLALAEQCV